MVIAGQRATFNGTDKLDHQIGQVPGNDDFDNFAFDRDQHEDKAESSNYISPEMTGADDLDEYGHWNYAADYGPVWTPVGVAPGWAPYRFGHWVWVAPWGWTWVENEPWGFAPFHYGRWAFIGGGWGWVPGPVSCARSTLLLWSLSSAAAVLASGSASDRSAGSRWGRVRCSCPGTAPAASM